MRPSGNPRLRATSCLICALLTQIATLPLTALVEPADSPIRAKSFRHDDLYIGNVYVPATELQASRAQDLATLGVGPDAAFMDVRSGRWGTLMPRQALLPGDGRGNNLEWEQLGLTAPAGDAEHRELAWNAVIGYLSQHQDVLGIDISELASPGKVTLHNGGDLVQIHATRVIGGVPVRDSFVKAAISHGNLILLGAAKWDDVGISTAPAISVDTAIGVASGYLGALADGAKLAQVRPRHRADGQGRRSQPGGPRQRLFLPPGLGPAPGLPRRRGR